MIFLSRLTAGLSVALLDYFLKRRIICIMYSLGGLCIVCAGILPAGFRRACGGGGIFWAAKTGAGGVAAMRKCWYPSWILVKNWVSADVGISGDIFLLDNIGGIR